MSQGTRTSTKRKRNSFNLLTADLTITRPSTKRKRTSFKLLNTDLTELGPKNIGGIFLLDSTKVPDGEPTGVSYEVLNNENYPDLEESKLNMNFLPFLVRKCAVDQLDAFRLMREYFDENGGFDDKGAILKGPAGAGKSYVLYHIVHFCRASGWLVLYVPTLGTLKDYDSESAACTILKRFLMAETDKLKNIEYDVISKISLYDFIKNSLKEERYLETWKKFFGLIRAKELKYPVLVAVDEWNAKFDVSECKDLFNYFALEKLNSGFWLYAISSSFGPIPIDGFQNADRQTLSVDIPRYSQLEFDAIMDCQQYFKRLPQKINAKEIEYHSGRIPLMIFFWCKASRGNLQTSFTVILDEFKEAAEGYYKQRIFKTLQRAGELYALERKIVFQVAANVCLNTLMWKLPELWDISGLFVREQDSGGFAHFACACPSVSNAFMNYLLNHKDQIIGVSAADPDTKGRAFELLVTLLFHTHSKTVVTLPNKDLGGYYRNPKNLYVAVNRVIMQAESFTDGHLRPGTLLILRKGYHVCNLVIYSEDLDLYFIQISIQSYMDQKKKPSNLKDVLPETGKTVLEYYMDLCMDNDGNRRFPKVKPEDLDNIDTRLPKGVYYVYISMSNSLVRRRTKYPVVLVRQEDLGRTMGAMWRLHENSLLA